MQPLGAGTAAGGAEHDDGEPRDRGACEKRAVRAHGLSYHEHPQQPIGRPRAGPDDQNARLPRNGR